VSTQPKSKGALIRFAGAVAIITGLAILVGLVWREQQPKRPKNVLLITLDTTRPDALGPYGAKGVLTPVLDRLAAGGNVFEQAYSHAPITLPSHSSILTGLTPPQHGVRNNISYRLDPSHPT
jgi:arylsulfatase A-like enzyme